MFTLLVRRCGAALGCCVVVLFEMVVVAECVDEDRSISSGGAMDDEFELLLCT